MTDDINEELAQGILAWYEFDEEAKVLVISDNSILADYLSEKELSVEKMSISQSASPPFLENRKSFFDYVVVVAMLEKCREPVAMLRRWKSVLKDSGHLLLGAENRLGVKYFCGKKEPETAEPFQGIENYYHKLPGYVSDMKSRLYSKRELESFLDSAGFISRKIFSVFPNLQSAQFIFADGNSPNEDMGVRIVPQYSSCDTIMVDEQHLYADLARNGLFHQMANAFFFDCASSNLSDALSATVSVDRDKPFKTATIIHSDKTVEKVALEKEGCENLKRLHSNMEYLRDRGIKVVETKLSKRSLTMPYVDGTSAVFYLRNLLETDKDALIEKMDHFRDLILQSSPHVKESDDDGVILEKGFVDMVPINAFYENGDFVFIDQEFCVENYPANAIIFRMVAFLYDLEPRRLSLLPQDFFFERYGISKTIGKWIDMSKEIVPMFRKSDVIEAYLKRHTVSYSQIQKNRTKLCNDGLIKKSVVDSCFSNIEGKKVYMWGTGKFANKFYSFYKDSFDIAGVIDSDSSKWGTMFHDKCVMPPRSLENCNKQKSKVIVCIKDFSDTYQQLLNMGFDNIGVFDANHVYEGRQSLVPSLKALNKNKDTKKYHIGYIAGVFDLFHIGHLNMFRRAKEQCDYLIAAVVTDRGVRDGKKREPYIPFEERVEMVRSCKYVDEVVEIPYDYPGTVEAFQKYHFDVQFSGSDYVNHPWWLEQQKWLREHGADLVFFPYTEQTSSTKIKALIEKGLL